MTTKGNGKNPAKSVDFEAIIVGAGFGGIRALHEMRKLGLSVRLFEAGSDVGGTWYWNRYPGARTDSESWSYCFYFSRELMEEWNWPERMPSWQHVQNYMRYTVDRFDMRKDMQFDTRVRSAHYNEEENYWTITTERGESYTCTYFISAIGWFEVPTKPEFKGLDSFAGQWYLSCRWPEKPVDFTGKRVGIVGAGSTAVQIFTTVAKTAKHVSLFQRTPNYVMPSRNYPLDEADQQSIKRDYDAIVAQIRKQVFAFPMKDSTLRYDDVNDEQRKAILDAGWEAGGFRFLFETFCDIFVDERSNAAASEFVRNKIRAIVKDPVVAEKLCPRYPIALKRPPTCNFYYETFNRPNVSLVDISESPIDEIVPGGIRVGAEHHELDIIIFAMGFDAVTGPLSNLDVRGRGGETIRNKWQAGPRTSLGIGIDGFPNLFIVTGPQAPFANVPPIVEAAVTWIGQAITHMREKGYDRMEASPEAVESWAQLMQTMVNATLLRHAGSQRSWYMGANIPGKPQTVLFYFGGAEAYFNDIERVAANGFEGFNLSRTGETVEPA
ncbi:flavin-containing monooxygenase [Paraburkholderia xenovorans]|uniref:flavin-containing monooxygenase n=1 Tax=Paraburkholderia xenovorans TaxID=36873 RepID=UPI001559DB46|nr:NAD(P)/FAD-dependent oxidoreductase [Paraburkholderia xenovorans]NPT39212.1 NAD(P)-binding protein [Paraburkholderia xenovorans]